MNKKQLQKVIDLRIKVKKAFLNAGKEITVVTCGKKYRIKTEKINGVLMGILYTDDIKGVALNSKVVEKIIEMDESL